MKMKKKRREGEEGGEGEKKEEGGEEGKEEGKDEGKEEGKEEEKKEGGDEKKGGDDFSLVAGFNTTAVPPPCSACNQLV